MDSTEVDQELLDQISEAFTAAIRRGESPSVDRWVSRHRECAGPLRELLTSVAMIEGLKQSASRHDGAKGDASTRRAPTQLDDYKIVREIGRGGMGVVYEAVHQSLARRVAVKVLSSRLTGDANNLSRFEREAQAAARLRHPNIVPVFGVGHADGIHYYVMEYIEGRSVREFLRHAADENPSATPTIPSDDRQYFNSVAKLGASLCDALQYAHSQDVLHRDVKPDNLLLDKHGEVWITDFGLAKLTQQPSTTQTGDLLGTPQYMAPESFEGRFDRRSEIYCVGLTLYEMLTKTPAIAGSNPADTLRKAMSGVASRPRQLNPLVPRDLETVIVKSLSVDPASRYASAGEMRDDLNRFVSDVPVLARRIGMTERSMRWARREPVLAGLTIATLVSLMTALVVAGIGYYQTKKSLEVATTASANAEQSLQQRSDALKLAEQQRARAESNLQVAITAFDEIMRNVTQRGESLDAEFIGELSESTSPSVSSADAELLKSLLGFFDQLAENNSEDFRIQSADASRRVGDIYQRLGQLRQADQAYQRCVTLHQALADQSPTEPTFAINQAQALNERAVIAGLMGKPFVAGQLYEQTIRCLQRSEEASNSSAGRYQQARAQMLLMSIRSRAGLEESRARPILRRGTQDDVPHNSFQTHPERDLAAVRGPAAMAIVDDMLLTLNDLLDESPESIDYRMMLARAYRIASKVASQNRFPGPSQAWTRHSLRILDELDRESPGSEAIRYELAKTLASSESLGTERMMHLVRAIRICDSLLDRNPNVLRYQALKAHTLGSVADLQRLAGSDDVMQTLGNQVAIQRQLIQESPELVTYRTKLAQTLERVSDLYTKSGESDQAAKFLQQAIDALVPAVRRPDPSNVARVQLQRLRGKLNRTTDQPE